MVPYHLTLRFTNRLNANARLPVKEGTIRTETQKLLDIRNKQVAKQQLNELNEYIGRFAQNYKKIKSKNYKNKHRTEALRLKGLKILSRIKEPLARRSQLENFYLDEANYY